MCLSRWVFARIFPRRYEYVSNACLHGYCSILKYAYNELLLILKDLL